MSATSPSIWVLAGPEREARSRGAFVLVACAAVDALAAGILLVGTSLPHPLELLSAAALHATAILLIVGHSHERPSLRWLSAAALLVVPFAGVAIAGAILGTTGRGTVSIGRHRRTRRRPTLTRAELLRMGGALSPCEALECDDEDQRRDALAALSRRGDAEAIVLLRRAAASRDPDLALSAALALDEIGERAERELRRSRTAEVRHGAG